MSEERFLQSKTFRGILYGLGVFAVALLLFAAGMFVGSRKALFACDWGRNYYRNFAGDDARGPGPSGGRGWFRPDSGRPAMSGHGVLGSIISVDGDAFIVRGRDDVERDVVVNDGTVIKKERDTIALTDLQIGDDVMVFGSPDGTGRIAASLVRVMTAWPPVPSAQPSK